MGTHLVPVLCLAALSASLSFGRASAQAQYQGIASPPYEFFEALLNQSEAGDYPSLTRSIGYLGPLFAALRDQLGVDSESGIRAAISARDPRRARAEVLRLVFLDMRLNLDGAARVAAAGKRAELLQMAYTDYCFLQPDVVGSSRALDQSIRATLKQAYRTTQRQQVEQAAADVLGRLSPLFALPGPHATR